VFSLYKLYKRNENQGLISLGFSFKLFLLVFLIISISTKANWVNQNTGIHDNLNGVRFWASPNLNGLICAEHGIYYSTNTAYGAGGTWTRFNINGNHSDSLIYNSTHFYKISLNLQNVAFICGWDSSTNQGVIFKFNLDSLTYSIPYIGPVGSKLNFITFEAGGDTILLACGNNGLVVRSNDMVNYTIENSGTTNDLYCISSDVGSSVCIGGNGIYINGTDNGYTLSLTPHSFPTINLKSFLSVSSVGTIGIGAAVYNFAASGNSYSTSTYFDFGPLNCTSSSFNGLGFIATDHGVYAPEGTTPVYEFQVETTGYSLNDIIAFGGYSGAAAVGNNGLLLMCTDNGGATKPYCTFSTNGGCANYSFYVPGIIGTATSFDWYLNGAFLTSLQEAGCYIPTPGTYTLSYIVSNYYGYSDTATSIIQIIPAPIINTSVTYNDTFLCKSQTITITIDSTENNFDYYLYQTGTVNSYGGASGNGSVLTFTSNNISTTGNYNIVVSSPTYQCIKNYTDTIKLIVEHTKANFHATKANVTSGESTTFYQHCSQAVNYQWTFSPSAIPPNSSLPAPTVTFSSLGNTQIQLICWSSHGCYDTIQKQGPPVYIEPSTPDSCWTMVNNGVSPPTSNAIPNISDLSPSKTGFLTCGYFNQERFASRYGDSLTSPTTSGGYAAKYSQNGVLKWMVNTNTLGDDIYSVVEDNSGYIYLCGKSQGCFFDNTGDSTCLYYNGGLATGFIVKLDSTGILTWMLQGDGMYPNNLVIDGSNLLISLSLDPYSGGDVPLVLNGMPTDTLAASNGGQSLSNFILKIDSSGNVIWNLGMYISEGGISSIGVDSHHNVYVTGDKETYVNLYSVGSSTYTTIAANYAANYYWSSLFLAKFDSTGTYKWGINSDYSTPYNMITDSSGNCYVSGRNQFAFYSQPTYLFNNADGTTTSVDAGEYFIAKVNTQGICKWIQGNVASYYGFGYGINKLGNEISVVGQIFDNNPNNLETNSFTSQNNDSITLTIGASDYFIAVYDTLGNLISITKNGNNPLTIETNGAYEICMFRHSDGSYFMTKNIAFYGGSLYYNNFGTIIDSCNGFEGSITRFTKSCGITYYPSTVVAGLKDISDNSNILIYPNPNNGTFTIETSVTTKQIARLYDVNGKIVLNQIISGKSNIDASSLNEGVYNISILSNNGMVNKRLVIVR
jgi:hypothetical protein